jgi:hypothetical protein
MFEQLPLAQVMNHPFHTKSLSSYRDALQPERQIVEVAREMIPAGQSNSSELMPLLAHLAPKFQNPFALGVHGTPVALCIVLMSGQSLKEKYLLLKSLLLCSLYIF